MIAVIADDITGAAEIAGIGFRFGLHVSLVTNWDEIPKCDLLVCATDTRSLSEEEAIAITLKLATQLKEFGCNKIFKKTDSVLRGHIIAELTALMKVIKSTCTVLIPENPSRNRIIKNGVYYVDNQPLDQTLFAHDPEYPASTSEVEVLLDGKATLVNQPDEIKDKGIFIVNASSEEDILLFAKSLNERTLPAGGADFFTSYLTAQGFKEKKAEKEFSGIDSRNVLIICGSTVNNPITASKSNGQIEIPLCKMPADVFEGKDPTEWIHALTVTYQKHSSLILSIHHLSKGGKPFASRLKDVMAKATSALVMAGPPQELIIEGGATAYSILNTLNWTSFQLTDEIEPGVIRMIPHINPGTFITVKPGSYPWGEKLFK